MASPDAELKVRIEAELGNFVASMRKGTTALEDFDSAAVFKNLNKSLRVAQANAELFGNQLAADVSKIGAYKSAINQLVAGGFSPTSKEVTGLANNIHVLDGAIKGSGSGMGNLSKGSSSAAFALTNLGRVAQDAPFGFIGIQNNLNPLLESFQRLKAESGSTGSALKALGSSLIGPAGLGIALSVISAGILLWNEYQRKANKETVVSVDANKELAKSIKSISEVQADGRKNASGELSSLQSLYGATQNLNIPQAERLKIAKEILEKYPTYLKGMTAEGILAGQAATQYQKLTDAILAKGYVQAAEENRQKLINQQLNATVERTKEQIKLTNLNNDAKKRENQLNSTLDVQGRNALSPGLNKVKDEADKARQAIIGYNEVIKTGQNELKLLDNVVQGLVKDFGSDVLFDPEKPKKTGKEVKTVADIFKALNIDLEKVKASVDGTFGDKSKEQVSAFAKAIDELVGIGVKPTDGLVKGLQDRLLNVNTSEIKQSGKAVGITLSSGILDGFSEAIPVVAKDLSTKLKGGLTEWQSYVNNDLLPQVQGNFETFFNDILMHGKLSFESLGKAILNTFLSIIASDAARGVTNLLRVNTGAEFSATKGKGGGLLGGLAGLLGIGGKAAAAGGGTAAAAGGATAASGGLLLPILGGIAAGALIASLFKKKKADPQPAFSTSTNFSTAPVSNSSFDSGRVVFEISGVNLVGVLNRAGAKLQRFGP